MSKKTVTTVCGKEVPKSEARLIAGRYYLPGVSCFLFYVDGKEKYYRIESPFISYDYSTGKYALRKDLKHYGVVNLTKEKTPIFGRFSSYKGGPRAITTEDGNSYNEYSVLSYDILNSKWPEDISTGIFYDPRHPNLNLGKLKAKRKLNYGGVGIDYNANNKNPEFQKAIKAYESHHIPISKEVESIAKYFKDYTFGIEFETTTGTIPQYLLGKLGLIPLRDGSIAGYEYTTIPLKGVKGIQTIINICKELRKRCEYDHTCSMHIHIGGVRTDMLYLTVLYNLCSKIQDKVFRLVPHYKSDPINIAGLRKNYCQKLHDIGMSFPSNLFEMEKKSYDAQIKANYQALFNFCSGGQEAQVIDQPRQHPQGENKWQRHNRYFYVNFIPMIYDNKTIEFRLHAGTFNENKVLFWMLLNIAILEFADKAIREIHNMKDITLETIIEAFTGQFNEQSSDKALVDKMKKYLEWRVTMFKNCLANKDFMGKADVTLDKSALPITLLDSTVDEIDVLLAENFLLNNKLFGFKNIPKWTKDLMGDGDGIPIQMIEERKRKLVE